MKTELAPMGIGSIVGASLELYRRRFATFATISAVVYVPYALLMAEIAALVRSFLGEVTPDAGGDTSFWSRLEAPTIPVGGGLGHVFSGASSGFAFRPVDPGPLGVDPRALIAAAIVGFTGAILFLAFVYPLCSSALIVNISASHEGEDLSAAESYSRAAQRLGRLFTAQFLVTACVAFGVLCCVIPGILFSLWFIVVPAVVILEDQTAAGALQRSRALMRGNLGRGLLLGLAVGVIGLVMSAAGGWLITHVPAPTQFLADFLESLVQGLVLPFSVAATVVFYHDLRIRQTRAPAAAP